jgi:hypothetical protein
MMNIFGKAILTFWLPLLVCAHHKAHSSNLSDDSHRDDSYRPRTDTSKGFDNTYTSNEDFDALFGILNSPLTQQEIQDQIQKNAHISQDQRSKKSRTKETKKM